MAYIKCRHCGAEIEPGLHKCPRCGTNPASKRSMTLGAAAVIAGAILVAVIAIIVIIKDNPAVPSGSTTTVQPPVVENE